MSYVALLPPCKYELDLASNDDRSWALHKFNMLDPFMEMWQMLDNVTSEEIEECKQRALLASSPTKWILPRSWAMYMFLAGKYECEESAIVRVKLDIKTGGGQDLKCHSKFWN